MPLPSGRTLDCAPDRDRHASPVVAYWNVIKPTSTTTYAEQVALLSSMEREVLHVLGTGKSLRTVARHLALSDAVVSAHVRELQKKLHLTSMGAVREHAAALRDLLGVRAATTQVRPHPLQHQSRWLPNIRLSATMPLCSACRRAFNCQTLRDVADYLRDCSEQPGPLPDDPTAIIDHRAGTIGAKQALLAALAAECGRKDVHLLVACHELEIPSGSSTCARPTTLPMAVCYLRCQAREVQIAAPGGASMLRDRAVSVIRVEPRQLARERVHIYQRFAVDWCRALDLSPRDFARLRAEQLGRAERRSLFEDLLGHRLAPNYLPLL